MTNEQIERIINEKKELIEKGLTTRQHRLKDFLKTNFVSGKFFSIEEICNAGLGYTLNTNPYKHDKCVCLSNDIRAINFNITERYIPIIKDTKGGCKLAENKKEVDDFIANEREKVEAKCQYLNTLESKIERDGYSLFINQADRVLNEDEIKPIEVFAKWVGKKSITS